MKRKFAIAAATALTTAGLAATIAPAASAAVDNIARPASAAAYTPQDACGAGYATIDRHDIVGATIYLTYNSASGYNCVATIKNRDVGTPTFIEAWLSVQGDKSVDDYNAYTYYADVKAYARGKCVQWGGSTPYDFWYSPTWQHCG